MKKRLTAATLAAACVATLATTYLLGEPRKDQHSSLAALAQTAIAVEPGKPLRVPALRATDGAAFGAMRLRGRWSVLFFGFTSCPAVCPTTLQVMSAVAGDPASGVAAGTTQLVFVSVDPERDTPSQMKAYVGHFDGRILGLTGSRERLEDFAAALGAGFTPSDSSSGSGIDHSTSLFVVDPKGRLAGILLRPSDPVRIVADLQSIVAGPKKLQRE